MTTKSEAVPEVTQWTRLAWVECLTPVDRTHTDSEGPSIRRHKPYTDVRTPAGTKGRSFWTSVLENRFYKLERNYTHK